MVSARRPSHRPISAATTHQPTADGITSASSRSAAASQRHRRQRVAAPALSRTVVRRKSANRTSSSATSARSSSRTPLGAVDDDVGLLGELRAGPRRSGRRRGRACSSSPSSPARRGRGTRRGRSCRRRRRARRRGRRRAGSATIPTPLSIRTGGRISSTLRPQWVAKPASSALLGDRVDRRARGLLVGRAAPVERDDRPLVLEPHAQPPQLACRLAAELLHAARPGRQLGVELGLDPAGPQQLGAVRAEVGDRADRRRSARASEARRPLTQATTP